MFIFTLSFVGYYYKITDYARALFIADFATYIKMKSREVNTILLINYK